MYRWWRSVCLVAALGVVLGFIFNYYRGSRTLGFISPIVLAKELGGKNKTVTSPFGLLFNRDKKSKVISPSGSLSLAGPVNVQVGRILGQSTTSQNETVLTNPVVSASATSTSANSSPSNTSASTTQTAASTTSTSVNTATTITAPTTISLTATQQAVADVTNVVLGYLKSGNYTSLYNLMSADFKNTFTAEDFVVSFSSSSVSSGSVAADPRIFGANNEWAEQSIKLVLNDGSSQSYLNIYHWENNLQNYAWTLYATQDQ